MNVYERNYKKLLPLIEGNEEHKKIKVNGYMPLVIEKIGDDVYSIAHYYTQNGDLMADPEMEIKVYSHGMVEALSYTQHNIGLYQVVYPDYPDTRRYYPKLKSALNKFLGEWLTNLKKQGFIAKVRCPK